MHHATGVQRLRKIWLQSIFTEESVAIALRLRLCGCRSDSIDCHPFISTWQCSSRLTRPELTALPWQAIAVAFSILNAVSLSLTYRVESFISGNYITIVSWVLRWRLAHDRVVEKCDSVPSDRW